MTLGWQPYVLRLCSVYEAPPRSLRAAGFDAIGGMQVHTARLTRELDAMGVRQSIVTAWRPRAPRAEIVGEQAVVARVGVPTRRFRQLYVACAVPEVARLRPDVVHVHLGEDLAIGPLGRWASARADAPLVVTLHESVRHTIAPRDARTTILRAAGGPIERWLLRAADAILVLNSATLEALVAAGVPRTRIRLAPVGVDVDRFERPSIRPASMDARRRWVVYVGRLVREKGVSDLVAATANVRSPDVSLLVVGDGPDRARLELQARAQGVAGRVTFVGPLPHDRVPAYVQHADAVVLPSWTEERGRILLEAMAAGTPVIATRVGGIPETVEHGVTGLLVDPRDPARLAAAVDHLLGNRDAAVAMATAGRRVAAANSISALATTTTEIYRSVLADRIATRAVAIAS